MGKGSWSLLVCAILTMACREEKRDEPSIDSAGAAAIDTTEVPFTAPEVRRARTDTSSPDSASAADGMDATKPAASLPAPNASQVPPVQVATPVPPAAAVSAPSTPAPAVTAPAPPVAVSGAPLPGSTGEYVVQIDIHKSESEALKAVQKLATRGIPAYIVPAAADAGLSGSYWRVRVGRFASRADAQSYGENVLKPAGLKYWIDRKANEPAAGGKG